MIGHILHVVPFELFDKTLNPTCDTLEMKHGDGINNFQNWTYTWAGNSFKIEECFKAKQLCATCINEHVQCICKIWSALGKTYRWILYVLTKGWRTNREGPTYWVLCYTIIKIALVNMPRRSKIGSMANAFVLSVLLWKKICLAFSFKYMYRWTIWIWLFNS